MKEGPGWQVSRICLYSCGNMVEGDYFAVTKYPCTFQSCLVCCEVIEDLAEDEAVREQFNCKLHLFIFLHVYQAIYLMSTGLYFDCKIFYNKTSVPIYREIANTTILALGSCHWQQLFSHLHLYLLKQSLIFTFQVSPSSNASVPG